MRPKKVILCVDDNETALSVRKFLLETRGYRVIAVETSQEAIEILEHTVPGRLDLMIADLLMPGMDGNELVRRAKQMHPMLPCMIVSGTVANYDRALAADAFLPKGAGSSQELLERVRVLVARKRGRKKHVPSSYVPATDLASSTLAQSSRIAVSRAGEGNFSNRSNLA
jgi:two-component system response regulator CpxR